MISFGRGDARRRWAIKLAVLGLAVALSPTASGSATPVATVAHTGGVSAVTYRSASLTGAVNPGGKPTTYFFQYGTTARYGSQSAPGDVGAGTRMVGVTSTITGLLPLARYHYRLVAVNAAGTALGGDATLTTMGSNLSMELGVRPSPVTFGAPLSVAGTLNGPGGAGRTVVLQQNPYPFTQGFQSVGNPQLTSATGGFQFNLLSLPVTTQFLVVTVGPGQPVSGTLTEYVQLAVTVHVAIRHIRRAVFAVTFSGLISPDETGGRVSVQRLVGGQWKLLLASVSAPATPASSSYAITLNLRHGGFYRVSALPVDDSHAASFSEPLLVHLGTSTARSAPR